MVQNTLSSNHSAKPPIKSALATITPSAPSSGIVSSASIAYDVLESVESYLAVHSDIACETELSNSRHWWQNPEKDSHSAQKR